MPHGQPARGTDGPAGLLRRRDARGVRCSGLFGTFFLKPLFRRQLQVNPATTPQSGTKRWQRDPVSSTQVRARESERFEGAGT